MADDRRSKTSATLIRVAVARSLLALLVLIICLGCACAVMLRCRYEEGRRGTDGVAAPRVAMAAEPQPEGRIETALTYTCIDKDGTGEVEDTFVWDDAWFTEGDPAYDSELARTCAVLSTLAYSESGYYQASSTQPAYMEDALARLGFDEVSTESYRFRSEVVDQVLNLIMQQEDTVAYTLARKRVTTQTGETVSVILMVARGSYGSEWLSNLKLAIEDEMAGHEEQETGTDGDTGDAAEDATGVGTPTAAEMDAQSALEDAMGDSAHQGYSEAAEEVWTALSSWIDESHAAGERVTLVTCGHSRGGAIANLIAARAADELAYAQTETDEAASGAGALAGYTGAGADEDSSSRAHMAATDTVRAYTFASPRTTVSERAHDDRYSSIYNVVNPADIMPSLPLATWGYERYGCDVLLPRVGDDGFDAAHAQMEAQFKRVMGMPNQSVPADAHVVDTVVREVGEQVTSTAELMSPSGAAKAVGILGQHVDPERMLRGHMPSVYLAWLSACA